LFVSAGKPKLQLALVLDVCQQAVAEWTSEDNDTSGSLWTMVPVIKEVCKLQTQTGIAYFLTEHLEEQVYRDGLPAHQKRDISVFTQQISSHSQLPRELENVYVYEN